MIDLLMISLLMVLGGDKGKKNEPEEVVVKMKISVIKEKPDYAAKKITEVKEGTVLRVLEKLNNWSKVEYEPGKIGYVNNSAYVTRKLYIPSETAQASGDVRQIQETAAAKGFSKEIEADYRKKENLDQQYALLDNEILAKPAFKRLGPNNTVSIEEIAKLIEQFRKEGNLR